MSQTTNSFQYFTNLFSVFQSDETGGESVSDDDFQNESVSVCRATVQRAERKRAKAKVCATDGSAGCCDLRSVFSCNCKHNINMARI